MRGGEYFFVLCDIFGVFFSLTEIYIPHLSQSLPKPSKSWFPWSVGSLAANFYPKRIYFAKVGYFQRKVPTSKPYSRKCCTVRVGEKYEKSYKNHWK
jgi:hypothetical protein